MSSYHASAWFCTRERPEGGQGMGREGRGAVLDESTRKGLSVQVALHLGSERHRRERGTARAYQGRQLRTPLTLWVWSRWGPGGQQGARVGEPRRNGAGSPQEDRLPPSLQDPRSIRNRVPAGELGGRGCLGDRVWLPCDTLETMLHAGGPCRGSCLNPFKSWCYLVPH